MSKSSYISLTDLVRLSVRMSADNQSSLRNLQERDHRIGEQLSQAPNKKSRNEISVKPPSIPPSSIQPSKQTDKENTQRLQFWLSQTEPMNQNYYSLQKKEHAMSSWMTVLGLFIGVMTLSGLVFIDAKQPVNVLLFLTLFVGVQWFLLLLTLLMSVTPLSRFTGLHFLSENLNPIFWFFQRKLKKIAFKNEIDLASASSKQMTKPIIAWDYFSGATRLSVMRWGQVFGVAFNVGGLVAFFFILAFTDRNFGWSSTFNLASHNVFSFLDTLSIPWKTIFPSATITEEVVANSRYQFLQTQFSQPVVEAMRAWWPFLFTFLIVYGLLPRVCCWLLLRWQTKKQLQQAFLSYPGSRLVLDRMMSPIISTQSDQEETAAEKSTYSEEGVKTQFSNQVLIVDWVGALTASGNDIKTLLTDCGFQSYSLIEAGLAMDDDQTLISNCISKYESVLEDAKNTLDQKKIESLKNLDQFVIAVKSWEPPLDELSDFIDSLLKQSAFPQASVVYLLLIPLKKKKIKTAEETDWKNFAAKCSAQTSTHVWVIKADGLLSDNNNNKNSEVPA